MVADVRFDFVRWEVRAVSEQLGEWLLVRPEPIDSPQARDRVLRYLAVARHIGALEREAERLAALPDHDAATEAGIAALDRQMRALRTLQAGERPVVEAILEAQVARVIRDEGLGWLGSPLPPPTFRFSEPPNYLVLSPRDEIRTRLGLHLVPSLSLEERESIEQAVEALDDNVSALVSATGGFSSWPTMVVERAGLEWVLSTIAHEWTHLYLLPFPLGYRYFDSPDTTAINETVAQIVGDELGRRTLERYYPELAVTPPPPPGSATRVRPEPERFDFNREMRLTRERVDTLLAEGRVLEAEDYMEERRRYLVENGYYLRRLNQAYFAFHGSYRTGPAAPADDPIAPRLFRLRDESASLAGFLVDVRYLVTVDDLTALVPEP